MLPPENIVHLWLHHLEHWQSLVAGLLGFGGVITTLWVNAWLQRDMERRRREQEATTLLNALTADFAAQSIWTERWSFKDGFNPFDIPTPILDTVRDKLWLLDQKHIIVATGGMAVMEEIKGNLRSIYDQWVTLSQTMMENDHILRKAQQAATIASPELSRVIDDLKDARDNHMPALQARLEQQARTAASMLSRIASKLDENAVSTVRDVLAASGLKSADGARDLGTDGEPE